jgi:hypothetical protein
MLTRKSIVIGLILAEIADVVSTYCMFRVDPGAFEGNSFVAQIVAVPSLATVLKLALGVLFAGYAWRTRTPPSFALTLAIVVSLPTISNVTQIVWALAS